MNSNRIVCLTIIAISLNLVIFNAAAQKTKTVTKTTVKPASKSQEVPLKVPQKPEQPIALPDKDPAYPGGAEAIEQYFITALTPLNLKQKATVTLSLEIDETGKVKNATIKNGYRQLENRALVENPEVNKAIFEAALKMNTWQPGLIKGKPTGFQHDIQFIAMTPEQAKEMAEQVYVAVEKAPEFPGGEAALLEYFKKNLKYPKDAREKKLEGMVVMQFVVTRFGELKDIKVYRSLSESLDAEALRLTAGMPRWTPGKQNGRHVNIRYALPVTFKL